MKYSEHLIKRNFFLGKHHVEFLEQQSKESGDTIAEVLRQIIDKAMKVKKVD